MEPPQLWGRLAELRPKTPLCSVRSLCLPPQALGLFCLLGEADAKNWDVTAGGLRADGEGQVRLRASHTRAAFSGNRGLLFPGHVFPEFKESDAMFAAERVSSRGAGSRS